MYGCVGASGHVFRKIFCWGLQEGSDSKTRGRIPVHVFNCLGKPLNLHRCSSIGDLYPLAGDGESYEVINRGVGYEVVPPGAPKKDVEVGLEAKQCSAVFVKDVDVHSSAVEEMFPISSSLVPEETTMILTQ